MLHVIVFPVQCVASFMIIFKLQSFHWSCATVSEVSSLFCILLHIPLHFELLNYIYIVKAKRGVNKGVDEK